jgi:hypothetical protein
MAAAGGGALVANIALSHAELRNLEARDIIIIAVLFALAVGVPAVVSWLMLR